MCVFKKISIWPIENHELNKAIPLIIIKFLISFVYCVLTCIKDTVVVMADNSGAEVIPVIKSFFILPVSILVALLYSKLSNKFNSSSLFYSIIIFFVIIFGLYAFVLCPNKDFFTPSKSSILSLSTFLGDSYKHLLSVYVHWIHVLFFIVTELWGQVVIFLLYWGFVNNICNIDEAKRLYSILIAAGGIALIISGPLVSFYVTKYYHSEFLYTVQAVVSYAILGSVLTMITYFVMNNYFLNYDRITQKETVFNKTDLSLINSIKHIFTSKYLIAISMMVIGCAFCSNIVEVTWKAQLKKMYFNHADYQIFMSNFNFILGIITLLTLVFISGNLLQFIGWKVSAKITPLVIFFTGSIFFFVSYFSKNFDFFYKLINYTPLKVVVLLGAFQNLATKACKYAFFDSTKEIVFIPLDKESKVKGKAAIDLVGSRIGKSGSSVFQLFIMKLLNTSSILMITPFIIPVFIIMLIFWLYSINYLNDKVGFDK